MGTKATPVDNTTHTNMKGAKQWALRSLHWVHYYKTAPFFGGNAMQTIPARSLLVGWPFHWAASLQTTPALTKSTLYFF